MKPIDSTRISTDTLDMTAHIVLSTVIVLIALVLGILLRRSIVSRLHRTVLDRWIIETLGALSVLPPLVLGGILASATWNNLNLIVDTLNRTLHTDIYAASLNVLTTAILVALGIGTARTLRKLTIRGLSEQRIDINIRTLIARILYIIPLVVVTFWILSIWQIPLGVPVAAVSIITVAITVSVQDILKNLVAGLYILLERPFLIGDQISVPAPTSYYVGKVENVQLRATKLRLLSGEEITIPNSILFSNAVTNNTYYGERRAAIAVTLPESDFQQEATPAQIREILESIEGIMSKPEAEILFTELAEGKVTLLVRFWIASRSDNDVSAVMYKLHALLPNAELLVREPIGPT